MDLSRSGVAMVVTEHVPVDTLLLIEFVFEKERYSLSAVGRVVHARPQTDHSTRLGLDFVALPPDARKFLAENFA